MTDFTPFSRTITLPNGVTDVSGSQWGWVFDHSGTQLIGQGSGLSIIRQIDTGNATGTALLPTSLEDTLFQGFSVEGTDGYGGLYVMLGRVNRRLHFVDVSFTATQTNALKWVVDEGVAEDITFTRCSFIDSGGMGAEFHAHSETDETRRIKRITFLDCLFAGNASMGLSISGWAEDVEIIRPELHDNGATFLENVGCNRLFVKDMKMFGEMTQEPVRFSGARRMADCTIDGLTSEYPLQTGLLFRNTERLNLRRLDIEMEGDDNLIKLFSEDGTEAGGCSEFLIADSTLKTSSDKAIIHADLASGNNTLANCDLVSTNETRTTPIIGAYRGSKIFWNGGSASVLGQAALFDQSAGGQVETNDVLVDVQ